MSQQFTQLILVSTLLISIINAISIGTISEIFSDLTLVKDYGPKLYDINCTCSLKHEESIDFSSGPLLPIFFINSGNSYFTDAPDVNYDMDLDVFLTDFDGSYGFDPRNIFISPFGYVMYTEGIAGSSECNSNANENGNPAKKANQCDIGICELSARVYRVYSIDAACMAPYYKSKTEENEAINKEKYNETCPESKGKTNTNLYEVERAQDYVSTPVKYSKSNGDGSAVYEEVDIDGVASDVGLTANDGLPLQMMDYYVTNTTNDPHDVDYSQINCVGFLICLLTAGILGIKWQNGQTCNRFLLFSCGMAFITSGYCQPNSALLVYQTYDGLTSTEIANINNMVAMIPSLSWDGTSTSSEASLVTLINTGSYQVLLALNPQNWKVVWGGSTLAAVESALTNGTVERLIVWDRWAARHNDIVNVPDLNGFVNRSPAKVICPVVGSVPPSTGPAPEVGCWDYRYATHGHVTIVDFNNFLAIHPEAVALYKESGAPQGDKSTHVQYCFERRPVMYSATPMDHPLGRSDQKPLDYFINTMDLLMNTKCDTNSPSNAPTQPTMAPTSAPTMAPTQPTSDPTIDPTRDPTADPTTDPTNDPTTDPTRDPTTDPTIDPTTDPTIDPTRDPTTDPTVDPTSDPTTDPTRDPTIDPTSDPTTDPIESSDSNGASDSDSSEDCCRCPSTILSFEEESFQPDSGSGSRSNKARTTTPNESRTTKATVMATSRPNKSGSSSEENENALFEMERQMENDNENGCNKSCQSQIWMSWVMYGCFVLSIALNVVALFYICFYQNTIPLQEHYNASETLPDSLV